MAVSASHGSDASPATIRATLRRVVSSEVFAESPRLSAFLTYVVEARLSGEEDRIQEYGIGLHVFDRGESFDPRIDSIVRVEARRLRERLGRYNETEGVGDEIRIELPRRGYRPRFVANGSSPRPTSRRAFASRLPKIPLRVLAPWAVAAVALALAAWIWLNPPAPPPAAVEFAVEPPAGAQHIPVSLGGGAVISPDGERVAFVAGIPGGDRAIYVRELSANELQRVPGSEEARWPFWAPDSRRIGFAAGGSLKTADLDHQVAVRVAAAPDFGGGAWTERDGGWIVFNPRPAEGLVRVRESGGDVLTVTELATSNDRHLWPYFLPDGERFLYAAAPAGTWDAEIRLGELAAGQTRTLLKANSRAVYGEERGRGRLLFVRDETLFSQPFDAASARLAGKAQPLVGELNRRALHTLRFDFSVSMKGPWTYLHDAGQTGVNELVWRDRAGRKLGVVGKPDNYLYITLSPNERLIAAAIHDPATENVDLWTIDIDRGVKQRHTKEPHFDRMPVWSPDGESILINSNRPEGQETESKIYEVSLGAGVEREFLRYEPRISTNDWPNDWNQASGLVLFSRKGTIWSVKPGEDAKPLLQAPRFQWNARMSPDAQWIAYTSTESLSAEVWLINHPQLDRRLQVSEGGANYALWRADSKELFYVARDGELMAVDVDPRSDPPVSRPKRLFQTRLPFNPAPLVYRYAVSENGERFLCINPVAEPSPMVSLSFDRPRRR